MSKIDINIVNARWMRVLEVDIQNETALFNLINNNLKSGNFIEAVRFIGKLDSISLTSKLDRLFSLKIQCSLGCGDYRAAYLHWVDAVSARVVDGRSLFTTVSYFLGCDDPFHAWACLEACDDRISGCELGLLSRAKCLIHERRWPEAIDVLEKRENFSSHKELVANLLYRCYMSDFRHDSAALLAESLDSTDHKDKAFMLGKALYKQHRFPEAQESFTAAIRHDDHEDSNVWLIRTLYAVNNFDDALAKAELTIAIEDVHVRTKARCWEAAGKLSNAEEQYRCFADQSKKPEDWFLFLEFYMSYRRWADAYRLLKEAKSKGIWNVDMQGKLLEIESAFDATEQSLPASHESLRALQFFSSEKMVSSIVDRILKTRHSISPSLSSGVAATKDIAIIINSLGPGGAERQAVNLANGLVESEGGEAVSILCTYLQRKEQDCFYLPQVNQQVDVSEYYDRAVLLSVEDIPELSDYADLICHIQPASRQQLILHMCKKLIELKPNIVHGWLDETFINTALVCGMLNITSVVGRWGSLPPGVNRTVSEREQSNVDYLEHAYRAIGKLPFLTYSSNSRLTADAYAALIGIDPEDVNIVYNGIDDKKLAMDIAQSSGLRQTLGIPDNSLVVGTVFRMTEEKQPILWLDIARELSNRIDNVCFVVVGAGPIQCQMEDYILEHSLTNVHLVGKQSNIGAWMNLFDVFMLTSRVEGVSNAVVEAQFCGTPVVAANVGGLSEAMIDGSTGILLDGHDISGFVDAVISILSSPEKLKKLSENAVEFSNAKFSVPSMVTSYRTLFERSTLHQSVEKARAA